MDAKTKSLDEKAAAYTRARTAREQAALSLAAVRAMLAELNKEVDRLESAAKADPLNWGIVGDLGHIRSELRNMLAAED